MIRTIPHKLLSTRCLSTTLINRYQWFNNNFQGDISLISYNVLSQTHLEAQKHKLYSTVNPKCLNWDFRERLLREKLYNFIQGDGVSIFCLQEVDESKLKTFYRPFFKDYGYSMVYIKRPDLDKTKAHHLSRQVKSFPDGCAIVFKDDKFTKVKTEFIDFPADFKTRALERGAKRQYGESELRDFGYNSQSQTHHIAGNRHSNNLDLNYSNVGIIIKFREKKSKKEFVVCNTHLAFDPRKGDLKLAQLMLLLYKLQKFSVITDPQTKTDKLLPIILTGDFNIHSSSEIFNDFIINGEMDCREKATALLSGQLRTHTSKSTLAIPPIPKSLGIDYTNMGDLRKHESLQDVRDKEKRKWEEEIESQEWYKKKEHYKKKYAGRYSEHIPYERMEKNHPGGKDPWYHRDRSADQIKYEWGGYGVHNRESKLNVIKDDFLGGRLTKQFNQQYNQERDLYASLITPFIGHSLYFKMPYVKIYNDAKNSNNPKNQPVSTIMNASVKMQQEVIRRLCVDHTIVSENIPVYNYVKLPTKGDIESNRWKDKKQVLGFEHPSDHLPIGINFDIADPIEV